MSSPLEITNRPPEDSLIAYTTEESLQQGRPGAETECIFRIPRHVRDCNAAAYTPAVMAFGPYHATSKQIMRKRDLVVKYNILDSLTNTIRRGDLQQLVKVYRADSKVRKYDLPDLLAIDGLYVLLFLNCRRAVNLTALEYARVYNYDLSLLENQIPLQILECAWNALDPRILGNKSLESLVQAYVQNRSPFAEYEVPPLAIKERKHLLDCIYRAFTHPDSQDGMAKFDPRYKAVPSASCLRKYGIKIVPTKNNFTGIHFDQTIATLSLPVLTLGDELEPLLRNLIAYELSTRDWENAVIVIYVTFMDCLIDREEDVEVLVESKVLSNLLGSNKEAAAMWNGLCKDLPNRTHKAVGEIVRHCESRRHRWVAELKETYFDKRPWLLVSLLVAFLLLVNTLLQTIYILKSFYSKKGP